MKDNKLYFFVNQLIHALNNLDENKIRLGKAARLVLLSIGHYADNKTGEAHPLQLTIASHSGVSVYHINRYLKQLKQFGFITIKRKFTFNKGKRMTRNFYKINLDVIISVSKDGSNSTRIEQIGNSQVSIEIEPSVLSANGSITEQNRVYTNQIKGFEDCKEFEPLALSANRTTHKNITTHYYLNIPHASTNLVRLEQPDRFDEFWAVYPRKNDVKAARKAWHRYKLDDKADMIIADVLNRRENDLQWQTKEYIPYGATYLNGERWNDEILTIDEGKKHESAKTNNTIGRRSKTEESILRGLRDYEESRRRAGR